MPTETGFNTDWLFERFAFDSKARNKTVEAACLDFLSSRSTLNIVDVGSGSGSSCLYLMQKIKQDQNWTFVELNAELAKASLERIASFAQTQNWTADSHDNSLFIHTPEKKVQIEVINKSFLELDKIVDLENVDLVTAAAVFDLLTEQMLTAFLELLNNQEVALLSTINYSGMRFATESKADYLYADLYSQHMQREQPFGRTVGADCHNVMEDFFRKKHVQVISGESNWEIGNEDKKMHAFLLDYMSNAVPEMLTSEREVALFEEWLIEKKQLSGSGQLSLEVMHHDFFAKFA